MALSETDEELNRFEADIRQFKIQYEQYFGGGRQRPPNDVEWRIEETLKRYADRGAEMSYGQRFRYSGLVQNYVKFRDIYHKRMKNREEGVVRRHFGAAARKVEEQRRAAAAVVVGCLDLEREPEKVEQLCNAFREALERSGESTERFSRVGFANFLQQKALQLQKRAGKQGVEFIVSVEAGKARLKARVKA